ncbi:MAG: DUF167 domain-containing protein [Deltaproteobacteria bacterium]|nr:DUF167 domain-containing protein [Deltaproteobacteria bacterium]
MAVCNPLEQPGGISPFSATANGVSIKVRVRPRASKNQVEGAHNGALCVRLTSPPVEGAANAALIELFSKLLKIRKSAISIEAGGKSRDKRVFVEDVSLAQVEEALLG